MIEEAINEFKETYSIKSFISETSNRRTGIVTKNYSSAESFEAVIQPMSSDEVKAISSNEGEYTEQWITVYTSQNSSIYDIITYLGKDYEIQKKEVWDADSNYYRLSAINVTEN